MLGTNTRCSLERECLFGRLRLERVVAALEKPCPSDSPSSSYLSVVADQRALSMSGHTLSPTGADREASCTFSRILWAYSKPGVGEHRELLGLQTGLGGDELSWQRENRLNGNVCGVVELGLLGKATLYMNQLHSTQQTHPQQKFPNGLLTVHIYILRASFIVEDYEVYQ